MKVMKHITVRGASHPADMFPDLLGVYEKREGSISWKYACTFVRYIWPYHDDTAAMHLLREALVEVVTKGKCKDIIDATKSTKQRIISKEILLAGLKLVDKCDESEEARARVAEIKFDNLEVKCGDCDGTGTKMGCDGGKEDCAGMQWFGVKTQEFEGILGAKERHHDMSLVQAVCKQHEEGI